MKKKEDYKKWIALLLVITIGILLADLGSSMKLINTIIESLKPILIGVIIAYVLYLPARRIEEWFGKKDKKSFVYKKKRTLSIIITYVVLLLLILGMIRTIIPVISSSISDLLKNLPKNYTQIEESTIFNNEIGKYIVEQVEKIDFSKLFSWEKILGLFKNTISFAKSFFSIFVTIVVSIYLLAGRSGILAFWDKQAKANLSKEKYKDVCYYTKKANSIFTSYLSGQILDALIVGILMTIILLILNIKYAVLLGVIIGIANLIPFFGSIIGIGLSLIIIALTTGVNEAIIGGIIMIVMQQVDANIINPKITSSKVDISPILTIVSITVLGSVFGVLGMFLAVPIVAIIKTIMVDRADKKLKHSKKTIKE